MLVPASIVEEPPFRKSIEIDENPSLVGFLSNRSPTIGVSKRPPFEGRGPHERLSRFEDTLPGNKNNPLARSDRSRRETGAEELNCEQAAQRESIFLSFFLDSPKGPAL